MISQTLSTDTANTSDRPYSSSVQSSRPPLNLWWQQEGTPMNTHLWGKSGALKGAMRKDGNAALGSLTMSQFQMSGSTWTLLLRPPMHPLGLSYSPHRPMSESRLCPTLLDVAVTASTIGELQSGHPRRCSRVGMFHRQRFNSLLPPVGTTRI